MAKDNVPFHSVVFPATQLGTGKKWTMVDHLMAVEYLNYEDAKFSKSRGIGVFGNDAQQTGIPSDVWRFYLIYIRPESGDSAFKWDDLMLKNNSELLGNLGNFVNRALKFCKDNFAGRVPEMKLNKDDQIFLAQVTRHLAQFVDLMEGANQRESILQIMTISRLGNQLMQANTPWKLMKSKSEADRLRAGTVVSLSINTAALLAVLVQPFMPVLSSKLQCQLNLSDDMIPPLDKKFSCLLKPGHEIGVPEPLIREIKPDEIKDLQKRFGGKQEDRLKKENTSVVKPVINGPDPQKAKELEVQVSQQGDVVRKMKEQQQDKDLIKIEAEKLLSLKKDLALAQGKDPSDDQKKSSKNSGKKGKKKK